MSVLHDAVNVETLTGLSEFRDRFYGCLDARADALFELADAVLCTDGPVTSLVELSLAPVFRRGHGALYDALADGAVDEDRETASPAPPFGHRRSGGCHENRVSPKLVR